MQNDIGLFSVVYKEKIPFTKAAPIDEEESSKQKKQKAGQKKKQKGQGEAKIDDTTKDLDQMGIGN